MTTALQSPRFIPIPLARMTCSRRLYAAAALAVPGERVLDRAAVAEELDRAAVRALVDVHVHVRLAPRGNGGARARSVDRLLRLVRFGPPRPGRHGRAKSVPDPV